MFVENQVVIVTGSGQGIGKGIASVFADYGAIVIIAELQETLGEELEQQLLREGKKAKFIHTDVTDPQSIEKLIEDLMALYGRIDTLVNNAGITVFKPIFECTIEDWDHMINTDLRSVFLLSKAVGEIMVKQKSGSIINIASNHVSATLANTELYAAAKSGVVGFTKSLALSIGGEGVRVNAVSPGFMDTPHHQKWLKQYVNENEVQNHINGLHATNRIGQPKDVGNICVFLSSSLSRQITGTNIVIDGGLSTKLYNSKYE